jgi:hypothetical protein
MKVIVWFKGNLNPLKPMFDEIDPVGKIFVTEDKIIIDNGYHEYDYLLNEIDKITFGEIEPE